MTTRTASAILREIVNEKGKEANLAHKLRTNKERNWLLALILNSYANSAAGHPATDLDNVIVKAFDDAGFGDEMREQGRLYAQMSPAVRSQLFPGKFGQLAPNAAYTSANLVADLPQVQESILAMANATDVDVVGVHTGTAARAAFRRPRPSVVASHASELLRAVQPDAPGDVNEDPFSIKATSFHCTDETGIDWTGSDEPYWIFGSIGAGVAVTTKSSTFGDVDSGDTVSFAANEGWMWGQQGAPAPLPADDIGILVSLWEHDDGDPTKVKAAVAGAFAAAAGVLALSGAASWVGAVVAGVGAVVQWLLSYLDDDHIADQTFIFSRQTILDQIGKIGQSFAVTRQFTDGDGDYSLTITVAHVAPQSTTVVVPNVVGMTRATAISRIQAAGLVATSTVVSDGSGLAAARSGPVATRAEVGNGAHATRAALAAPIGTGGGGGPSGPPITFVVADQSPVGGTTVNRGSTVHLTVNRIDNR
jgi:hypothetical protein